MNGKSIVTRPSDTWIIDFGVNMPENEASLYEAPFAYVIEHVMHERKDKKWWLHERPRPELRRALKGLSRYIATPRVAKYRIFVWLLNSVLPDTRLNVVTRVDDVTFGLLSSRIHTIWTLATCTWIGVGNDPIYNAKSCFETFPFPEGVLTDPDPDAHFPEIAQAARCLNELRENWLNPPQWVDRVPEVVPGYPDRLIPKPEHAAELKKRTLTNLYNQRPAWLVNAHRALDEAVAAAYGWPADLRGCEKTLPEL